MNMNILDGDIRMIDHRGVGERFSFVKRDDVVVQHGYLLATVFTSMYAAWIARISATNEVVVLPWTMYREYKP